MKFLKLFSLADILLFVIIFSMSLVTLVVARNTKKPGVECVIESPTAPVHRIALAHDTTVTIPGTVGLTSIRINPNGVWVLDSPCRNKLCQRMGRIKNAGAVLACVPNGIVVRIEGATGLDAIAY